METGFAEAPAEAFWGIKNETWKETKLSLWLSFISYAGAHSAPFSSDVLLPTKKGEGKLIYFCFLSAM
jgi:hypothetical protein